METRWLGRLAAATAVLGALIVAGCGGSDSSSSKSDGGESGVGEVTIGVMAPFSGNYAVTGAPIKDGVDLWLKQHDNKLGGRTVKLEVADDKSTTQGSVNAATNLTRQKEVDAVVGLVNSAAALAARPTLMRGKAITMSVVANATELLDPEKAPYLFMVNAAADETAAPSAVLAKEHGFDNIVGVADNYIGARTWLDPSLDMMQELGIKVGSRIYPPFPTSDYGPYVSKIGKSGKPGAVYPVMFGPSALGFVKTYKSFDQTAPLYTTGSALEPASVFKDLLVAAEGAYAYWNYSPWIDTPENKTFREAFKAAYGRNPGAFELQSYVSMEFLDKAYAKAGPDADADEVRKALQEVSVTSPVGNLTLGPRQAVSWPIYLTKVAKGDDGELALVPVGPYVKDAHPKMTIAEAQANLVSAPSTDEQ